MAARRLARGTLLVALGVGVCFAAVYLWLYPAVMIGRLNRCQPPEWMDEVSSQVKLLVPPSATHIEAASYTDDCDRPNRIEISFTLDSGKESVQAAVRAEATANGWAATTPGGCLRKRIANFDTEIDVSWKPRSEWGLMPSIFHPLQNPDNNCLRGT